MLKVEVVYAGQHSPLFQVKMELKEGSTVEEALNYSGIQRIHPEVSGMPVGVYAKLVSLQTVLKEGDRVEIYRPLSWDPKESRRQKARLNKGKKV